MDQFERFSVPLVILEGGLKTEFLLKLFGCQTIIDRFYQKVTVISVGSYVHTTWISLHDFVWDTVIEIIV